VRTIRAIEDWLFSVVEKRCCPDLPAKFARVPVLHDNVRAMNDLTDARFKALLKTFGSAVLYTPEAISGRTPNESPLLPLRFESVAFERCALRRAHRRQHELRPDGLPVGFAPTKVVGASSSGQPNSARKLATSLLNPQAFRPGSSGWIHACGIDWIGGEGG
jgi:hypothetical protein